MRNLVAAGAAVFVASSLVACVSDDSGSPPAEDAGFTLPEDSATPGFDATVSQDGETDATADSAKPPPGADGGNDAPSSADAADGASSAVDGSDSGPDTGTGPDTGSDAATDAGPDAAAGSSFVSLGGDAGQGDAGFPRMSLVEWMTTGSINNQRGESAAAIPGGGFVWNAEFEVAIGGDYPPTWDGWASKGAYDVLLANMNGVVPGNWWGQSFGSAGGGDQDMCERGTVAVLPGGDILFTGLHEGTFGLGNLSFPTNGNYDVFLARVPNAAGSATSASAQGVSFGGTDSDAPHTIAVSADGKWVAIGGFFQSPSMTVPGVAGTLNHANDSAADDGGTVGYPNNWDAWVAIGSTTLGTFTYAAAWGAPAVEDEVTVLSFDANDNLYVGGIVGGAVTLPGGGSVGGLGDIDGFVFQLTYASATSQWSPGWSTTIGTPNQDDVQAIGVDPSNNVWAAGTYAAAMTLAGTMLPAGAFGSAGYLVRYDSSGTAQYASASVDNGEILPAGLAIDPQNGDVYLIGALNGSSSWGGPDLIGLGYPDGALLRFSNAGTLLTQSAVRGTGTQSFEAIAVDVNHVVAIAGYIDQPTDFGGGQLSPWYGGWDAFFATYHY